MVKYSLFTLPPSSLYLLEDNPFSDLGIVGLVDHLELGGRLEKPSICPNEIYHMITDCWRREPFERPTFIQLMARLNAFENMNSNRLVLQ